MDGQSMNFDGILQSVLQNPEMLKSAMELATKLSAGGGLSSLLSLGGAEPAAEAETESPKAAVEASRALAPKNEMRKQSDMWRHKKLLEALSLYVREDKRDLFDLILKLMDIVELANHVKR